MAALTVILAGPGPVSDAAADQPSAASTEPATAVRPVAPDAAALARVADLVRRGDDIYRRLRGSDQKTWEAIGFYQEALKLDPRSFDALWRLARALYWLADGTEDRGRKKDLGKQGVQYGQRAAETRPQRVEGWFWSTACLGEYSLGLGVMQALRQGVEGRYRSWVERSIALNPGYDWAGPARAYGRFYHKLPWPKRDRAKAQQYLRESLKRAPSMPRTHFYLADVLADDGNPAEARQQLELCLSGPTGDVDGPEVERYRRHCRALLEKLGR